MTVTMPVGADGPAIARGDFVLIAGHGVMNSHELTDDVVVIGRDPSCAIVIDHPTLSRRHARLCLGPPTTVQDLDSTNGVRVLRQTLRGGPPFALEPGETFHIGGFSFNLVRRDSDRGGASVRTGRERLVIDDPTVEGVPTLVRDTATTEVSVLILGESGVGKDVLAETIHQLSRRPGTLARINCAALPEALVESELFGHERGAFTGAAAAKLGLFESVPGGTVFLDEVGELPLTTQAKLLRAIEAREIVRLGATRAVPIDVRFIAATNRDLPAEVAAGRFRADLYFRLDGLTFALPSLRDRPGRISALALGFLAAAAARRGRGPLAFEPDVLPTLARYPWPGNVRELKAVIERATLLARGHQLGVRHLAFSPQPSAGAGAVATNPAAAAPDLADLSPQQHDQRRELIALLEKHAGNQTRAARSLGVSRTTLVNRLKLLRIGRPRM